MIVIKTSFYHNKYYYGNNLLNKKSLNYIVKMAQLIIIIGKDELNRLEEKSLKKVFLNI